MGGSVPSSVSADSLPEWSTNEMNGGSKDTKTATSLVFHGLCLICDVVHGSNEQCPSLFSKIRIRLALDDLKTSPVRGRPVEAIAAKKAILLQHLRSLELQNQ